MTSIDTAFERLREANPVLHPEVLRKRPTELTLLIAATVQKTASTEVPEASTRPEFVSRRRVWVVALASACLVAIAFLFVLLDRPTEPDVISPTTTVETVEPPATAGVDGWFQPTGTMTFPCSWCQAVLLGDGRVLVVGGEDEAGPIAELFDPASWTFSETGRSVGRLTMGSTGSAVRLLDGRVFFAVPGEPIEIYDPASASFESLGRSADGGAATLLLDGRVLAVGPAGAVLFDPNTNTFVPTGNPVVERSVPILTVLADGRVLVVSGDPDGSAELYDPVTGSFTLTGAMLVPRDSFTATPLLDGRVLIVGGARTTGDAEALASAEIYDPESGSFHTTGSLVLPPGTDGSATAARFWHAATRLLDGRVIIVGGTAGSGNAVPNAEIYDPGTGEFSPIVSAMTRPRVGPTVVTLGDGRVLILGNYPGNGLGSDLGSRSAEIFSLDPVEPPTGCCAANPTELLVIGQREPGPSGPRPYKVVVPTGGLAGAIEAFFTYSTGNQGGGGEWPLPADCVEGCEVLLPEYGENVSLQIVYAGTPPPQAKEIVIVESAFPAFGRSGN